MNKINTLLTLLELNILVRERINEIIRNIISDNEKKSKISREG